jgi:Domain of unknown function (DUF1996)/Domain of unknown function (DUF4124)
MNTLVNRSHIFALSVATVSFLLGSTLANAEIYKWRNNRGVIQYSDKPPVAGFSKADRHEIVNSLQAKDLCVEPTAKTAATASANKKIDANFFGGTTSVGFAAASSGFSGAATPSKAAAPRVSSFGTRPAVASNVTNSSAARPVANRYAPLNSIAGFGFGGQQVTVFGKPINVAAAPKPTVLATAPTPTSLPLAVTPKPTVVATAPTPAPTPPSAPAANPVTPPSQSTSGPNILQSALMPAVDISKQAAPMTGESSLRVQATSEKPTVNSDNTGQFRVVCGYSHMSNDDPIIYPNQQGAAHHHSFFGNTSADFKSNPSTLSTTGNSTCTGGIMNRSAYWVPSMIDTATKTPIKPDRIMVYYKTDSPGLVVTPPKGLRMIAGDSKSTVPQAEGLVRFTCNQDYNTRKLHIPACSQGQTMEETLSFPNCWDGKNLDSPDHKSHMAYRKSASCPTTHPVSIPDITFNVTYTVNTPGGTANWKLASDNYTGGTGGNSLHGDWMNGWDETFSAAFTNNCLKKGVDCHAHLIGDGRQFY